MLKPRRCNNTVDLTKSVEKGLKCFNLVLKRSYDTNLIWFSWEEIQHCWLLLSPENLKYILSILWVLSLVESYQDSILSHGWVPYVSWVSPMWLDTLFCESHVYHKIIGVIYMHRAYIFNFGHVSPRWSTICQLWPWMTPMSGYPFWAGSL